MLAGDLGFRAVLVLVLVVFPVIGLVIRRKWRLAAARREEIRRLLALASEEAARAELEASIDYAASYSQSPVVDVVSSAAFTTSSAQRYCAVCYSPTTSRCRRCKSVWYCSSKCQVIHWRQGHKHECSPPLVDSEISDVHSTFACESVKENHDCSNVAVKSTDEESQFVSSTVSPQYLHKKDNTLVAYARDGSVLESECSSVSASSWVSASGETYKTHVDDSVSEDENLHDLGASDDWPSHLGARKLDATLDPKELEEVNSSPCTSTLESVNTSQSSNTREESQSISGSASDCSIDSSVAELSASLSGFWNGSLESTRTKKNNQSDIIKHNYYDGAVDGIVPDSQSLLRFSFDLSGDPLSSLHSEGSDTSSFASAGAPETSKPSKEDTLSRKEATDSSRSNSVSLTSQQFTSIDKGTTNGPNGTKLSAINHLTNGPNGTKLSAVNHLTNGPNGTKLSAVNHLTSDASLEHPSMVDGCDSVAADAPKDHSSPKLVVTSEMRESSQLSKSDNVVMSRNSSTHPSASENNRISTSALKPAKVGNDNGVASLPNRDKNIQPDTSSTRKTSMLKVSQPRLPRLSRYYSFVGSGGNAKTSEKGLFPYELFLKLYNWNKVELRPRGFINCGNSCYANVVLQCLAFTPPLTAYLLQALHSKTCAKKEWCFTCEFERLILKVKDGGPPLTPRGILSRIENIGSHLANGREEDAHEFLRYAIDTMQSICLQEAGGSGSKSLEEETTLMGLTFGGYLRSKIRCTRCRGKSERHERIMDLTVEIEGDIDTLEDALRKFTATETLDGENKYQCSRCESYVKAKKKLSILEAPNVLTIALKRFQSGKFGKLNKSIRFPEFLDLASYMRGACDKSPIYRLYGVVVHLDIMNATFSGHYVCYVRNVQNKWFKIDDSTVKAVEVESVLKKGAYMLFYSRCSPRAPQTVRKCPEGDLSQGSGGRNSSRMRGGGDGKSVLSSQIGSPDIDYIVPNPETGIFPRVPSFQEVDSLSKTSSIFSHSDERSSTTDSNPESSTSTDDLSDYIFGEGMLNHYNYWRNSSDSDTSSSSSTSSSPLYMTRRSHLSNSDRYASGRPDVSGFDGGNSRSTMDACDPNDGERGEVSVLQSDSVKHGRKLVNTSSYKETDSSERVVGCSNPLDNAKSSVYQRRSASKRPD